MPCSVQYQLTTSTAANLILTTLCSLLSILAIIVCFAAHCGTKLSREYAKLLMAAMLLVQILTETIIYNGDIMSNEIFL